VETALPGGAAAAATVAAPTWRATPRRRFVKDDVHDDMILHALRGDVTLCGLTARIFSWSDVADPDEFPRCAGCLAVPAGHLTRHDLTALGITYRQLDHWTRQGWLPVDNPNCGSGSTRTFPPETGGIVSKMAAYTAAGVIASAAYHAVTHDGWLSDTVRVVIDF
jgi:hypothetical protein